MEQVTPKWVCAGKIAQDPSHDYNKPETVEINYNRHGKVVSVVRRKICQTCNLHYRWIDFGPRE